MKNEESYTPRKILIFFFKSAQFLETDGGKLDSYGQL